MFDLDLWVVSVCVTMYIHWFTVNQTRCLKVIHKKKATIKPTTTHDQENSQHKKQER